MPCIVGNVKILSVGSSGIVQFGDAVFLSPESTTKTFAGAGSFITGDLPVVNNGISATNTYDPDLLDSNTVRAGGV
ncbi:spore germination protein [Paenibacillus senegalensis]|uniref:spore germination protein n=1 Tax=Paenibacillus senegalensis TaxID=1465766 RepID=UPI00028A1333|nr:spore germination protein [Paenibacillus senegalensis]